MFWVILHVQFGRLFIQFEIADARPNIRVRLQPLTLPRESWCSLVLLRLLISRDRDRPIEVNIRCWLLLRLWHLTILRRIGQHKSQAFL